MADLDLTAIEARVAVRTSDWRAYPDMGPDAVVIDGNVAHWRGAAADAASLADVPTLLAEVKRLRRAHKAVKHTVVCDDCGWACYLDDEHPDGCPVCEVSAAPAPAARLLRACDEALAVMLDGYAGRIVDPLGEWHEAIWSFLRAICRARGKKPPRTLPDAWPVDDQRIG